TGAADDAHRLVLVPPLRPIGDHFVDLGDALPTGLRGVVTRIADQILAAEHLQQAVPMIRLTGEHIDPVVRAPRRARKDTARGRRATGRALSAARPARR